MRELLSFEQAPPFEVPLRFLLSAIPFGIAAGVLLTFSGNGLASRWSAASLALTHLLTVGFMLQAMLGAMLQLTPVAIGATVASSRRLAQWTHPLVLIGAAALPAGFLSGNRICFLLAALALALALLIFFVAIMVALWRAPARTPSQRAMQFALLGLAVTAALGVALALARAGHAPPGVMLTTAGHLRAGWLGWGLMLVCAASFLVVPMFQMTPKYPDAFQRWFPALLLLAVALSIGGVNARLTDAVLALLAIGYATTTLRLQHKRKRPRTDSSFAFWRTALLCVLAAGVLALLQPLLPPWPELEVAIGILVLLGGFVSVLCAMMYKIVPFLVWLHLNNSGAEALLMHQVIDERRMRLHLRLHLAALLVALPAPWLNWLAVPAGLLLIGAHLSQAANMAGGLGRYRQRRRDAACQGR